MTLTAKLLWAGGIAGALTALITFTTLASSTVDEYRPWATRETEIVVAGFQLDRFSTDARDIEARILRLESKQKINPRQWSVEDQAELNYWRAERDRVRQRIDTLRQQQRPMYIR